MKTHMKNIVVAMLATGVFAAAGPSVAGSTAQGPIQLTDAQMDLVVAGSSWTDTYTIDTIQWFFGYSHVSSAPGSPGSSQVLTTDTYTREMTCVGGSVNSCYAPEHPTGLNPNTVVTSDTLTSTTSTILSGPGQR